MRQSRPDKNTDNETARNMSRRKTGKVLVANQLERVLSGGPSDAFGASSHVDVGPIKLPGEGPDELAGGGERRRVEGLGLVEHRGRRIVKESRGGVSGCCPRLLGDAAREREGGEEGQ